MTTTPKDKIGLSPGCIRTLLACCDSDSETEAAEAEAAVALAEWEVERMAAEIEHVLELDRLKAIELPDSYRAALSRTLIESGYRKAGGE